MTSQKLNPKLCPLCGKPNLCAMEIAKATGQALEPCWCVNAYFTPELMAKLPEEAKGQACICAGCAAKAAWQRNPLTQSP
ncbi:cysteine-rich CWC family protein [Limnohabitans sp. Rim8]|uniref:cysteine-rich CWC family protein n=1 Tax=Limnohabitans sp. Rim8 TaxID=1100718 RepID=UPI002609EC43|nr:cysteine-rich CWC family protein [Limnohabitans sp. Rim8]